MPWHEQVEALVGRAMATSSNMRISHSRVNRFYGKRSTLTIQLDITP